MRPRFDIDNNLPVMSAPGDGLSFTAANWKTEAAEVPDIEVQEFDEVVSPYVLEATPPVLSVGARCMLHGFTFIWLAGECPYFVRPDGYWIHLRVIGNVPYLVPGHQWCAPVKRLMWMSSRWIPLTGR